MHPEIDGPNLLSLKSLFSEVEPLKLRSLLHEELFLDL
jgi:hypothetical protein